ncbi:hypothetical protein LJPFL01_2628 [Lelliottia jeotgali]|nr:hypothetical protein LJPFL01_2628 [Lelliottia jeotgali]
MSIADANNSDKDVQRYYFPARLSVSMKIELLLYYLFCILLLLSASDNPRQFISLFFVLNLSFISRTEYLILKMP